MKGTQIYLAGASVELDTIERYMEEVRKAGYLITFDWTVPVRKSGALSLLTNINALAAAVDLAAVRMAHIVWVLAPPLGIASTGCWVEFGAALAGGIPVIISGGFDRCIFARLATYRFDTHQEACNFLTDN